MTTLFRVVQSGVKHARAGGEVGRWPQTQQTSLALGRLFLLLGPALARLVRKENGYQPTISARTRGDF